MPAVAQTSVSIGPARQPGVTKEDAWRTEYPVSPLSPLQAVHHCRIAHSLLQSPAAGEKEAHHPGKSFRTILSIQHPLGRRGCQLSRTAVLSMLWSSSFSPRAQHTPRPSPDALCAVRVINTGFYSLDFGSMGTRGGILSHSNIPLAPCLSRPLL